MSPEEGLALLAPALQCERPLLRIDDLRAQLATHDAQLWRGSRSAIFTQVTRYASGETVLESAPAGGDLNEIIAMIPYIEGKARDALGCTQITVTIGRRGWVKPLVAHGYEEFSTTLRKIIA